MKKINVFLAFYKPKNSLKHKRFEPFKPIKIHETDAESLTPPELAGQYTLNSIYSEVLIPNSDIDFYFFKLEDKKNLNEKSGIFLEHSYCKK